MVIHGHTCGLYCSFGCRTWWIVRRKEGSGPFPLSFRPFFQHYCQSPEGILNSEIQRGFSVSYILSWGLCTQVAPHTTSQSIEKKLLSFKRGCAPISGISEHVVSRSLLACIVAVQLAMHKMFSLPISLCTLVFPTWCNIWLQYRDKKSRIDYQRSH